MDHAAATVALSRFGLGPAPAQRAAVASDPRGWLTEQLATPDPDTPQRLAARPDTASTVRRTVDGMRGTEDERRALRDHSQEVYRGDAATHLRAAASSSTPFRERLVAVWANHFTVSVARKEVLPIAGAFEREVIRAHLDGSFADMVLASTRHPAMLAYLDNLKSIGPGSRVGQRRGRGLNENLARELMELHTLGVDGGYTQDDVRAMAELLTGWSLELDGGMSARMALAMGGDPSFTGGFGFQPRMHQPGSKTLLGTRYPEGEDGGVQAVRDLARHPSTARNVARRLVDHFHPAPAEPAADASVDRLARAFLDSEGHLPTVHAALVRDDALWQAPGARLKAPRDLVIGTARAVALADEGEAMAEALVALGQPPWRAPSPQGWSDDDRDWAGPEQVLTRVEWLQRVARTLDARPADVRDRADDLFGPTLSARTRDVLARSRGRDALWVLLCSPEMQRR